jgi:hypothetical protein
MAYLREKIKNLGLSTILFLAIVFLLPIQTRIVHFFPDSHLKQNYVFYNTLFLHLTDILLILAGFILLYKNKFRVKHHYRSALLVIVAIFVLSVFSVVVSHETNIYLLIFGLFKLVIGITLFCFTLNILSVKPVKQWVNIIFWLILAISIFELILGVSQYFSQQSLGLKILGEEYLRSGLDGVAKFKIQDSSLWTFDLWFGVSRETYIMRPYGTFPHPNVFGAFMGFATIFTYYLFLVSRGTLGKALIGLALFAQIFTITISFSRVAISAWLLASIVLFALYYVLGGGQLGKLFGVKLSMEEGDGPGLQRRNLGQLAVLVVCSLVFCATVFYPQFLERGGVVSYGTTNNEAITDRLLYQKVALEMIKKEPLSGVGYQNFVMAMDEYSPVPLKPYQHQPVHNIYLLIAAETGILGLLAFLLLIFLVVKSAFVNSLTPLRIAALAAFIGFLFIGFFDHYLLTIQQGRLMFFLVAGILVAGDFAHNENKKTSLR